VGLTVLGDGLDDQVGVRGQGVDGRNRRHPSQHLLRGLGECAAFGCSLQPGGDAVQCRGRGLRAALHDGHGRTGRREGLGDTGAHAPAADHPDDCGG
jgi:hypothetical protein